MNRTSWLVVIALLFLAGSSWLTIRTQQAEAARQAEQARYAELVAREQAEVEAQRARAAEAVAKNGGQATEKGGQAPLVHTVIFYLKKDTGPAECDAMIADCHKMLAKIPTVRHMWAGKPVEKSTGAFVVKDYQFGLSIHCDDADGLQKYIDHPQHKEFVAKHQAHIEKVVVYDFVHELAK